jgi:hypothetical protein
VDGGADASGCSEAEHREVLRLAAGRNNQRMLAWHHA